ncbi:MAG: proton-conducting transporter membrane subunit [Planctomycetaceae bacterium]
MNTASGTALAAAGVCVAAPLFGAGVLRFTERRGDPRFIAIGSMATSLVAAAVLAASWHLADGLPICFGHRLAAGDMLFVDGLTALLLPYVALVDLAIVLVAPRRAFASAGVRRLLIGTAVTFATFMTSHPVMLTALWAVSILSTWLTIRGTLGGQTTARVYGRMMIPALVCMAGGTALLVADPPWVTGSGSAGAAGGWLVALAVTIRKGLIPFHSWYPALFSGASLATALMVTMPQVATYTAARLLVGHADGVPNELVLLANAALVTAAYGATLAVVQKDVRGLVGMLAMSQSAMVFAGLAGTVPTELCGALAVWVSSGLALTGIGLVTWALESRGGRISIEALQGRFADAPALAAFFLLFGLAAFGFPGTLSFVADDLIIAGSLDDHIHAGILVIITTVFAAVAVIRGWFRVFGGPITVDAPRHAILSRERIAFMGLLAILFGLGLWPGPFVRSLETVAESLLASRQHRAAAAPLGENR